MPEPISTPVRSCFSGVSAFQPASASACVGGGHGVDDEVVDLALLLGLHPVVGIERAVASRRRAARSRRSGRRGRRPRTPSMRRAPLLPASSRDQVASTPQPSGVTRPSPVMTTRRMHADPRTFCDGSVGRRRDAVAEHRRRRSDAAERQAALACFSRNLTASPTVWIVLGGIVGNLAAELLLERHDQLDGVEAVGAEIVDEAGVVGDLVGLDAEMLDDDLLHALCDVAHRSIPRLCSLIQAVAGRSHRPSDRGPSLRARHATRHGAASTGPTAPFPG